MKRAGHRLLPHTADVRLEAWGPTLEACLDQAVGALAAVFVAVPADAPRVRVPVNLASGAPGERLVSLLEEALFIVDVEGLVPVHLRVREGAGEFEAVALADVDQVGSVPKAIARSDLEIAAAAGQWRAVVTVDV